MTGPFEDEDREQYEATHRGYLDGGDTYEDADREAYLATHAGYLRDDE